MAVRCRPLVTPKEKSDFYRKSRKEAWIRASHLTAALIQQYSARYPLIGGPDKNKCKTLSSSSACYKRGFCALHSGECSTRNPRWAVRQFVKRFCQRSLPPLLYHEDLHPTPNTSKQWKSSGIWPDKNRPCERVWTKCGNKNRSDWLRVAYKLVTSCFWPYENRKLWKRTESWDDTTNKRKKSVALQEGVPSENIRWQQPFKMAREEIWNGKTEPRTAPFFPAAAVTNH